MNHLNESMVLAIRDLCEASNNNKYWNLIVDYVSANRPSDKRNHLNDIVTLLDTDLYKEARALVSSGLIDSEEEALSMIFPKIGKLIQKYYDVNKSKDKPTGTFLSLVKKAVRNAAQDKRKASERHTQAIGRATATYGSGQGEVRGGQRVGADSGYEGRKPELGKAEKRGVRRAIDKVLKKIAAKDKDKAEFIKALIGWTPSYQPTADDLAAIVGGDKRTMRSLKLTPKSVIKLGKLGDVIRPGAKGMGFKRGSATKAASTAGISKNPEWLSSTRKQFSREMCNALKSDPSTSHLFYGKNCDKVLGFTESVGVIFDVPSRYLSEDSAEDMIIRLCIEACQDE